MSFQFTPHHLIDSKKWDEVIINSNNSKVYALYEYLNTICKWDAYILNNYEAVIPLPNKKKFGLNYLYQPFFCQQLGVFSTYNIKNETFSHLIELIKNKYTFGEFNINSNGISNQLIQDFQLKHKKNYILSLNKSYQEIQSEFSLKCKQSIKKFIPFKHNIKKNNNIKEIIQFYYKNYGDKSPEIKEDNYHTLYELLNLKLFKTHCYSYYNNSNQSIEGVAVFIEFNNIIYYLIGGSINEAKRNCFLFGIIDDIIQNNAGKNFIIDFEGSEIANVERFIKSFGAQLQPYYHMKFTSNFIIDKFIQLYHFNKKGQSKF